MTRLARIAPVGIVVVAALLALSMAVGPSGASSGTFSPTAAGVSTTAASSPAPAYSAPPAPPVATGSAQPAGGAIHIPVGGGPDAVLLDPTNSSAFVASQFGNNITVISLATDRVVTTIPVGSEPAPGALALDPINWTVYDANAGSNNVSVLSISEDVVLSSVTVGASPDAVAYDSGNHLVYVANGGTGTVSILSPLTTAVPRVIDNVPVGPEPDALAVDPTTHAVYVASAGTDNVSEVSGSSNTVLASVRVGTDPGASGAMIFDPYDGDVFVANYGSNNVSVIAAGNHTLVGTVPVGTGPSAIAIDSTGAEVFVVNHYSDNVTVLSGKNFTILGSIEVGSGPSDDGAVAANPTLHTLYVPNEDTDTVSVISTETNTVVATIPVGLSPGAIGADATNGAVYVANQGSSNVSAFSLDQVTFRETGLSVGASWSVRAGPPTQTGSNTITKGKGTISFFEFGGPITYAITAPAGYGVASVTGPFDPTQTSANLTTSSLLLTVKFAPIETLTFTELGLAPGTVWSVGISSAVKHSGAPSQTESGNDGTLTFSAVKGSWKFQVHAPSIYRAKPAHGGVGVPAHAVTKKLKFVLLTGKASFREVGLVKGTRWFVNVTGPEDVNATSTTPTLTIPLENGTYQYTVSNYSMTHPHPASGTFTIVAPAAAVPVTILFTSVASHAGAVRGDGASGSEVGAPVATRALVAVAARELR